MQAQLMQAGKGNFARDDRAKRTCWAETSMAMDGESMCGDASGKNQPPGESKFFKLLESFAGTMRAPTDQGKSGITRINRSTEGMLARAQPALTPAVRPSSS
jgi:hypothetical protein